MSVPRPKQRRAWCRLAALVGWALACTNLLTVVDRDAIAAEAPPDMAVHETPRSVEPFEFRDGAGNEYTLDDFRSRVVVLNLWATWCPPCREEMPTLDQLQERLGGADFEVVALSLDRRGESVVRKFYDDIGVEHLRLYLASGMDLISRLRAPGLPTTLVLDRRGREVARVVGKADWATPRMIRYLRRLIEREPAEDGPARPETPTARETVRR